MNTKFDIEERVSFLEQKMERLKELMEMQIEFAKKFESRTKEWPNIIETLNLIDEQSDILVEHADAIRDIRKRLDDKK